MSLILLGISMNSTACASENATNGNTGGECEAGLNCDSGAENGESTDDTSVMGRWLETRGNKIYHSDGTVFHGRGVNIFDTRSCAACVWSEPNVDEVKRRIDMVVDEWGASYLRLVMESYNQSVADEYGMSNWKGPSDDRGYLDDLVEIVDYIGSKSGVYVLVSLWESPTLDEIGWPTDATISVWETVAEAMVGFPYVLFGICNEPQDNWSGDDDAAVWEWMDTVAAAIRNVEEENNSPKHLIAVQGTREWGRHLGYYVDHPIQAGGGENIVYETHSYLKEADFGAYWLDYVDALPIIIGEFGPSDLGGGESMTIDDTIAMMDAAEASDTPWTAWSFHQRCPPNLLEDIEGEGCGVNMELRPTEWGRVIRGRLSQPWQN